MSSTDPKMAFPLSRVKYDDKTGRPYINKKVRGIDGIVRTRRRYGYIHECIECGDEFLKVNKSSEGYCSRSCARKGKPTVRSAGVKQVKLWNDKLFSMAIREGGKCERCGNTDYKTLQCAHVFSRRYTSVRWTWDNALCLCKGCHFWGHANPLEWEDFCIDHLGEARYYELKRQARELLENRTMFYELTLERMEVLLEEKSGTPRPDVFVEYTYRQRERLANY